MASSEQDVEECDATEVEISVVAGLIFFLKQELKICPSMYLLPGELLHH